MNKHSDLIGFVQASLSPLVNTWCSLCGFVQKIILISFFVFLVFLLSCEMVGFLSVESWITPHLHSPSTMWESSFM